MLARGRETLCGMAFGFGRFAGRSLREWQANFVRILDRRFAIAKEWAEVDDAFTGT